MDNPPPGIRRLCVAFGIEKPDGCGAAGMASAEEWAAKAFTDVCASVGLDRMLLHCQPAGEQQVGLLPVGIDEPRVVSSLVDGLFRALTELSIPPNGRAPVRLRLAFHEGVTTLAADGFGGNAVATVRQMAKSPHLQAALDEHPRASLAVLLSDPVFQEIEHFGYSGLPTDQFRLVEIADPRSSPRNIAWIYVPLRGNAD
jgi:hypothetical protein